GALADVDEAFLVAVDERPQQHGPNEAEDGGVGADPEREGEDHGRRQPLHADERPKRVRELLSKTHGSPLFRPAAPRSCLRCASPAGMVCSGPHPSCRSGRGHFDTESRKFSLYTRRGPGRSRPIPSSPEINLGPGSERWELQVWRDPDGQG